MSLEARVLSLLSEAAAEDHGTFAHQLRTARVQGRQVWPDGSLYVDLQVIGHMPLNAKERNKLTGTHPGLPFELHLGTSSLMGIVWFDSAGTVPAKLEVNAMPEDNFNPDTCPLEGLKVTIAQAGPTTS